LGRRAHNRFKRRVGFAEQAKLNLTIAAPLPNI
jgi:hypothetical protein